jgi:hypothetical protein
MTLSYIVGQRKNPIRYPLRDIGLYTLLALALFCVMEVLPESWSPVARMSVNTVLIGIFVAFIIKKDLSLASLPVVGKFFRAKSEK